MTLRGEWWIDNMGQSLFADGDVGDMNHEAYVIDRLTRAILEALHVDFNEEFAGLLGDHDEDIRTALKLTEESPQEEVRAALLKAVEHLWPDKDQREAAVAAAYDEGDPRLYAVQYDGWKRVHGNNVETWTLTKDDLEAIANGISDIVGNEVDDGEEFYIEVRKVNRCYEGVPWAVLEKAEPGALRPYQVL